MEPEQTQKKSNSLLWVILLIIFLLALGGFVYWYLVMRETAEEAPAVTTTKVSTTSSKPATESANTPDDIALITAALVTKTGIVADKIDVTVSTNDGKYAKGTVSAKDEMGGGYFLAVKINGAWVIVHDGQDNPKCSDVNPHNFPATMVPECFDSNGAIVKR